MKECGKAFSHVRNLRVHQTVFMLGKDYLNVKNVGRLSDLISNLLNIEEFILVRDLMNVRFVGRPLGCKDILVNMRKSVMA